MSDPINPPGTAEPGQTLTGPEQAVAKGLVVAARVLERLADGQTKLLMNGRVVSAQVEALLRAGETVRLQVLETSPPPDSGPAIIRDRRTRSRSRFSTPIRVGRRRSSGGRRPLGPGRAQTRANYPGPGGR